MTRQDLFDVVDHHRADASIRVPDSTCEVGRELDLVVLSEGRVLWDRFFGEDVYGEADTARLAEVEKRLEIDDLGAADEDDGCVLSDRFQLRLV